MRTHEFTVIAAGLDPEAADFEDRFFEAGCGDATLSVQKGVILVAFSREASGFLRAAWSALNDVAAAGATVLHIEPDPLVTLSDIAERAGVTRAAVSLYAKGERGTGFPAPISRVTTESPLWEWSRVARWFHRQGRLPLDAVLQARIIRRLNGEIEKKRFDRAA